MRPCSSMGALSVGPLSLNSLIGSERARFAFLLFPLSHTLFLSLSHSLPRLLFIFYGRSVKPEAEERARRRSATHTGLGRHGYRNHDLAFSTLRGSARYLSRHLHIKLTHNARHISGNHWRVFVPAMRRQRETKCGERTDLRKGESITGKIERRRSNQPRSFCHAGSFFNGQLVSNMH